ncbi:MAG TPA: cell division protein CrgA [Jiangellaceae bacterium]|nr:cell division protein CrgA [Jiangellaceae bacterium]
MPRSRIRRKVDFTPPAATQGGGTGISSRWVAPLMVTLLVLGLLWIVVYYLTESSLPLMSALGGWNLVIGMGLITAGFITATKWR